MPFNFLCTSVNTSVTIRGMKRLSEPELVRIKQKAEEIYQKIFPHNIAGLTNREWIAVKIGYQIAIDELTDKVKKKLEGHSTDPSH